MRKIKKGDDVIVITGKNKGLRGKILKILESGSRVLVAGVNLVKRHKKADTHTRAKGEIIEKEAPLAVSNVQLFNPKTQKADRVFIKVLDDGRKIRCFKSTGEEVKN